MPSLNDDQFDERLHEHLDDDFSDAENDSLLDEDDAADLALMREALDNYKTESLRFAEQQSAAMPPPRVNKVVALWDSTPRWAVGATAVLALTLSTVFATHHPVEPAPVIMASAPTAQTLADDNQLLLSVNQALTPTMAAPSEEELGLTAIPAHNTKRERATN